MVVDQTDISSSVWAAYNIQRNDIATVRTQLLLRMLLVDAEPFEEILQVNCDLSDSLIELRSVTCYSSKLFSSRKRLQTVNRLFRIVSDVTSPAFVVEGQQWHSSVIETFYHYFSAMWLDPSVRRLYNSPAKSTEVS